MKVAALMGCRFFMGMYTGEWKADFGLRIWDFGKVALLMQREIYMGTVYRRV